MTIDPIDHTCAYSCANYAHEYAPGAAIFIQRGNLRSRDIAGLIGRCARPLISLLRKRWRIRRIRDEYETSTSAYSCSGKERLAPLSPRSFQDAEARQKLPGLAVRVNHILSLGLALLPFFFGFQQGTVSRPAKRTARNPLNGHAREKEESNKSVISYPAFS